MWEWWRFQEIAALARFSSLREPKRAPREPRMAPRWPHESPRKPQESPREPRMAPREPQESPRGCRRLSLGSLGALLGLSWGSLGHSSCSANLSFTEVKLSVTKTTDFDYKISCEVNCQKTIEFLFKNVHHSRTRAPKWVCRTHFSTFQTSYTWWQHGLYLPKHQFYDGKTIGCGKSSCCD